MHENTDSDFNIVQPNNNCCEISQCPLYVCCFGFLYILHEMDIWHLKSNFNKTKAVFAQSNKKQTKVLNNTMLGFSCTLRYREKTTKKINMSVSKNLHYT